MNLSMTLANNYGGQLYNNKPLTIVAQLSILDVCGGLGHAVYIALISRKRQYTHR